MDVTGISAIVTGGGRRIGRAIALELAAGGANVVVHCNRSIDDARETAAKIHQLGRRAEVVCANQTDWNGVARVCEETWEAMGGVDVLVNNAAVFERTPVAEVTEEDWDRLVDTNLKGPFAFARFLGPRMKARGRGKIISLADVGAEQVWPGYIPYCISKAGIAAMTRGLAKAFAPEVQVNAIAPGAILWPEGASEEHKAKVLRDIPLRRMGSTDDVARAVRFLIENDYITGVCLPIDGGRSLS